MTKEEFVTEVAQNLKTALETAEKAKDLTEEFTKDMTDEELDVLGQELIDALGEDFEERWTSVFES